MLIWQYDDIPRVGWSEVVREDAHDEGFVGISDGRHAIDERADDGAETSRNPPTSRASSAQTRAPRACAERHMLPAR